MSVFRLEIRLGNDAMKSGDDIQRALALTASAIANRFGGMSMPESGGIIRDANGNTVGGWETVDDVAPTDLI